MPIIDAFITVFSMSEIFTPPAACATSWTYEPEGANNVDGGLILQNGATFVSSCFPSSFRHVGRIEGSQIYSPGYCPGGYTSADVVVDKEVTTAICCLSDFDYYTSVETYEDGGSDTFAGCTSMYPKGNSTIIPVREATTSTRVVGPVTMWAQPITVALDSSDSSLFVPPTTSSTASIARETAAPTTTTTAAAEGTLSANETDPDSATESSQPETEENPSNGLPTAAGVGIGVGVGVGGLAVFAAVGLWFWRLRKSKKQATALAMGSTAVYNGHGPVYGREPMPPHSWPKPVCEVDGENAGRYRGSPQELYG